MKIDTEKREARFTDLGLSADLTNVLTRLKFTTPTPIQEKAIPEALQGKDVIGIAQTGTGKTLAFFLPMLQNLKQTHGTGLIVVPTRELATQVRDEIERVGGALGFKSTVLIGGANMDRQIHSLKRNPHVIVATPGRLNDHIDRRTVKLDRVSVLVLDEADRMLDMGFAPQINQILESVPNDRQTMLFSATMPDGIAKITHKYMNNPVRIEVAPAGTSAKNIDQCAYYVDGSNKFYLLKDLLQEYKGKPVLIFCRTKHGTRKMAGTLNREGFRSEELHSNRTLNQRRYALENFKKGKSHVLVATDVASRGIDVKEIAVVVNYDLPDQNEDYVHRIGRTGRAGHKGRAVSFVQPDQHRDLKSIERLVGKQIAVLSGPGTLNEEEVRRVALRYGNSGGGRRAPHRRRSSGGGGGRRPFNRGGSRPGNARGGRPQGRSRSKPAYARA